VVSEDFNGKNLTILTNALAYLCHSFSEEEKEFSCCLHLLEAARLRGRELLLHELLLLLLLHHLNLLVAATLVQLVSRPVEKKSQ
jgi:hypothetical protein